MENNLKQQFTKWKHHHRNEIPYVSVWTNGSFAKAFEKVLAIKELILCAEYLKKGESKEEWSFYLLEGTVALWQQPSFITFESQEAGQQAYDILGEESILKTLL